MSGNMAIFLVIVAIAVAGTLLVERSRPQPLEPINAAWIFLACCAWPISIAAYLLLH